jgi:hypothetical protein
MITSGKDTNSLITVNFIPIKDTSNIAIGILQIAEAPI